MQIQIEYGEIPTRARFASSVMAQSPHEGEWKCTREDSGVPSVIKNLGRLLLTLCADSWAIQGLCHSG